MNSPADRPVDSARSRCAGGPGPAIPAVGGGRWRLDMAQSTCAPDERTTAPHFSASACSSRLNSSGWVA